MYLDGCIGVTYNLCWVKPCAVPLYGEEETITCSSLNGEETTINYSSLNGEEETMYYFS